MNNMQVPNMPRNILTLPEVALEKILSSLTYDEISKYRLVCQKFNEIGGQLLTRGFRQIERRHNTLHKKMRAQLPRRESERRTHPLSKHCDILTAVETRLSMLSMTYLKYTLNKVCCFIPGKVLDEIVRILDIVQTVDQPPRTPELLQELRDISSMAMEHFDENILPRLQQKVDISNVIQCTSRKNSSPLMVLKQGFSKEMRSFKRQTKWNKYQMASLFKSFKYMDNKVKRQSKLLHKCNFSMQEQARYIEEQNAKIKEQEAAIAELRKHAEEWDQKFLDLTTEVVSSREELHAIKPASATQPQLINQANINIKPRTPLKYYDPPALPDFERKRKLAFSNSSSETPPKLPRTLDDIKIVNVINKNLTNNISKRFTTNTNVRMSDAALNRGNNLGISGITGFLSNSLERIIKNPINTIRSRKRKLSGDINFAL